MKKIIVVDWLDKYGGAERVIAYLDQVFQFDKMYTLINLMNKNDLEKLTNNKPRLIVDTKLRWFGKKFRWIYPIFFGVIKTINIDPDTDLIISSSHSIAKGVKKTRKDQLHISYFQHSNNNYIWGQIDVYLGKYKYALYPLIKILRKLDYKQAQNPDYIICNSKFVQKWTKETYNRDSVVIYPPVDFDNFDFNDQKEDYYIIIGRLATIKRFDIVIKAFNKLGKRLIVIGDGEESSYLKQIAGNNIEFLGFLESSQINNYLNKAKAFIQMGVEGFGIAPLEAQYCGTPVIGFGEGALLETVITDKTGIFFYEQSTEALIKSIEEFEGKTFNYSEINQHARKFSIDNFKKNIEEFFYNIMNKTAFKNKS